MLYIKTDLKNRNWLIYIIEEFLRINRANFQVKVVDISEPAEFENIIYYTKRVFDRRTIINKSDVLPNGEIKAISKDIFIVKDTETNDNRFLFSYDIFWSAFVFLSRYEEYLSEESGNKINSYCFNHPRREKTTFGIPVVNLLFNEIEKMINNNFNNLTLKKKKKPLIELIHDLDYIEKTMQLRLKRTALNAYNTMRILNKPADFFSQALNTIKFAFSSPSYWCFDHLSIIENKINKKSIFYVYAKTEGRNSISKLYNPSYDIKENTKLRGKLRELLSRGFAIGLHGSIESSENGKLMAKEKDILENVIGQKVDKIRQHWLKYKENITPYIHEKLFEYDYTLGWNDRIGFRSGCASKYRTYDHKNQRVFSHYEIPQVIMDSNIYDYGFGRERQIEEKAFEILDTINSSKSAHVSISWHQHVCANDYNWNIFYAKILNSI